MEKPRIAYTCVLGYGSVLLNIDEEPKYCHWESMRNIQKMCRQNNGSCPEYCPIELFLRSHPADGFPDTKSGE
jgi:hypothetical protein